VAGRGGAGYSRDRGRAVKAQLNLPTSIALDRAGDVYIANTRERPGPHGRAGRCDHDRGRQLRSANRSRRGRTAGRAGLARPMGDAVGADCRLYIADTDDNRVRVVRG
jgi:hypothetical protein